MQLSLGEGWDVNGFDLVGRGGEFWFRRHVLLFVGGFPEMDGWVDRFSG